jgi:hypothetical protein
MQFFHWGYFPVIWENILGLTTFPTLLLNSVRAAECLTGRRGYGLIAAERLLNSNFSRFLRRGVIFYGPAYHKEKPEVKRGIIL